MEKTTCCVSSAKNVYPIKGNIDSSGMRRVLNPPLLVNNRKQEIGDHEDPRVSGKGIV